MTRTDTWNIDRDLDDLLLQTETDWRALKSARIFITGGTGFIGCWLLESLRHANERLQLGVEATVLTRSRERFRVKAPHLADYPAFRFVEGDVCDFPAPAGDFSHIIHAATDASAALNDNDPLHMFDTIVNGTRRVLEVAREKSVDRLLLLSSGAVYGRQPWEMDRVPEEWTGAPNCVDPQAAYGEGKRAAEMLCAIHGRQFGVQVAIARIFSLLGPYLSLDTHFAAGNFIRDALAGRPVIVKGDGLACRSYLYAADLAAWLWVMLVRAEPGIAYNVGSDEPVSIGELAERVSRVLGNGEFQVLGASDAGWNPGRYVPDTQRIRRELGLSMTVTLEEAIRRTAIWHGWKGKQ